MGGNAFYSAAHVVRDPIGAMTRVFEDHYRA